jgi:hypothetical protein
MASIKQILDKHFFSFLDENGLESLKEKMIETIIKAEYELDDMIDNIDDDTQYKSICIDLENDIDLLNKEIEELEEELKNKDKFFEPKTLQDEFKIQWIKDNWDKIPSI